MEWLMDLDTKWLLAINGAHSPLADRLMLFFSAIPVWIPLYIVIAALMFYPKWQTFRGEKVPFWAVGAVSLLGAALCFGLCDQISVLIKESVCRFRPGHEPALEGMVRLLEGRGGDYGFVSSHAANTFGLATFTTLIFRKRGYGAAIFCWAATVGFSRIYLAKHYPLDVICGAALGIVLGLAVYHLWKTVLHKYEMHRR